MNAHVFKKKSATTNNNRNNKTKFTRTSGKCRIFSSVCIGLLSTRLKTQNELDVNRIMSLPPPPKSPNFNIIKNFRDELNSSVRRTGANPTTLNQPRAKILCEWNNLPQNYVQRYVTSMRRHCLAVVNSAGGGTYPLLSSHRHGRRCRIRPKNIVIFTLFCDISYQAWSLLKYWKNVNFDFAINSNFAIAFVNFFIYSK